VFFLTQSSEDFYRVHILTGAVHGICLADFRRMVQKQYFVGDALES